MHADAPVASADRRARRRGADLRAAVRAEAAAGAARGSEEIYLTASDVLLPAGLEFVNIVPRQIQLAVGAR